MKKLFAIIFATVIVVTVFSPDAKAQWNSSVYFEADELKGTPSSYMTMYTDDSGTFVCLSNSNENILSVTTATSIFNYDNYHNVKIVIGFYKDGALLKRKTVSAFVSKGGGNRALISSYGAKGLPDKILNHLINVGDVRIIAPLFRGGDFDITISMNPDIKLLKQVSSEESAE